LKKADAKIRDHWRTIYVPQQNVLGLDIPMYDTHRMSVCDTCANLFKEHQGFDGIVLPERRSLRQRTRRAVLGHEEVRLRFEVRGVDANDVRMLKGESCLNFTTEAGQPAGMLKPL